MCRIAQNTGMHHKSAIRRKLPVQALGADWCGADQREVKKEAVPKRSFSFAALHRDKMMAMEERATKPSRRR